MRSRLCLVMAVALIPLLGMVALTARQWRSHELDDTRRAAILLARHFAAQYQREFQHVRAMLDRLQHLSRSTHTAAELASVLQSMLQEDSRHTALGRVTAAGEATVVGVASEATQAGFASRRIFARARGAGSVEVAEFEPDRSGRLVSLTVAASDGGPPASRGDVVFATTDLRWMEQLAASEALMPEGAAILVFDSSGATLASWPEAPAAFGGADSHERIVATALGRRRGGTSESFEQDIGNSIIAAFTPMSFFNERDLFVAVAVPRRSATAAADWLIVRIALAFAAAILLAIGLAGVVSDRLIVRPTRKVIETTRRLSSGDLAATVHVPAAPAELQQLIVEVNGLAASLRERDAELRRQQDKTEIEMRRFRALADQASYGMALLDPEGIPLCASLPAARLLGTELPELLGRRLVSFAHEDDRLAVEAEIADAAQGTSGSADFRFRARTHAGSWREVDVTIRNLIDDPQVGALAATLRPAAPEPDERGQPGAAAEDWAEQTVERLTLAVEQTADSVLITDREGVIQYVNPAFERMSGYSREEAIGRHPNLLRSGVHTTEFYAELWRTILSGQSFRCVTTNRARDGRLYDEEQTIGPIRDASGTITHFVSTGRDITRRRRTQEALRRMNRQLEEQAARIAEVLHDEAGQFLTSAHIGLAELAKELDDPLRERLHGIRRHLDTVEERLRGISHEIHPSIVKDLGLTDAVKFLAEGFSRRAGIKVIPTSLLTRRHPLPAENVLYRCVQEALTNMGRHSRATSGEVVLTESAGEIACVIRDNGVGFDVDALGVGLRGSLGLRGMQDRLEALGGTLKVTSSRGSGTEVRAHVPLES